MDVFLKFVFMKESSDFGERFIESIVGMSWSRYLTNVNMSLQDTWANHIIIQAVADAMNLKIHIIESDSNYRDNIGSTSKCDI